MNMQKVIDVFFLSLLLCFSFTAHEVAAQLHPTYPPLPEALAALESDFKVNIKKTDVAEWEENSNFYYAFQPNIKNPTIGFIIYPGALVDPAAYAPPAHAIAEQGYLVVIVKMVDDLAIKSYARADRIISDYPTIKKWIIGGHSLGGSMACAYAKDFTAKVQGVVLWASYPSETFRIDDKSLKVISIYGTKDGAVEEIKDNNIYLPPDTQWVAIEGGNHTQFGYYWDGVDEDFVQPLDNPAEISRDQQQRQIIKATSDFLTQFKENSCPAVYLLGAGDIRLSRLRQFRDTVLAKSSAGEKLMRLYYFNGKRITALFDNSPAIKYSAKRLLELFIPLVEFLLVF